MESVSDSVCVLAFLGCSYLGLLQRKIDLLLTKVDKALKEIKEIKIKLKDTQQESFIVDNSKYKVGKRDQKHITW